MDDLLKKLNTLVSAQVNDLASKLPSFDRKPDVSRQVNDLKERVDTAMAHEDELRNTVLTLRDEIANLDGQVNAALQNGREPIARALLEQMQRLEKRLAFAESDLRQHQAAATDLIVRVSALEAVVQNSQGQSAPAQAKASITPPPVQHASAPSGSGSIGALMDAALTRDAEPAKPVAEAAPTVNQPHVEALVEPEIPVTPAEVEQPLQAAPIVPVEPTAPTAPVTETAPVRPVTPVAPATQATLATPAADEAVEKPYTAKDKARDARAGAEKQLERTNEGFESVGGLLRDIQARTKSRMESLDKMLKEGGLLDDAPPAKPGGSAPSDKPNKGNDLEDRLKRLSKPD